MMLMSESDVLLVSGGVDNAEANRRIGDAIGSAYHAMTSNEAKIGGIFGLAGAVVGAVIHMKNNH